MKIGVCIAALLCASVAHAQDAKDFPNRPLRIMGGGVGSTADYLSRFIGHKLNEKWSQPVVVDSRSGAGGTLAADIVAKAAPDGYNLVMGHAGPMVSAVALYKDLPYDPVKDFAPVSRMTTGVVVLVTHPSIPVSNTKELIAYIKQKRLVHHRPDAARSGDEAQSGNYRGAEQTRCEGDVAHAGCGSVAINAGRIGRFREERTRALDADYQGGGD